MAGHGHGKDHGHGRGHGGTDVADGVEDDRGFGDDAGFGRNGRDGGPVDEQQGEGVGDAPGASPMGRGPSDQSPGHLKKAAGAQSARDFAPGRARRD